MTPPAHQPPACPVAPAYPFEPTTDNPQGLAPEYDMIGPVTEVRLADDRPAYVLTRYADVTRALEDPQVSREAADRLGLPGQPDLSNGMLGNDGKKHDRLRGVAQPAFSLRRVRALGPEIAQIADDLLTAMLAEQARAGMVDLVPLFALPLPLTVIGNILGVPEADRPQFEHWSDRFLSTGAASETESQEAKAGMFGFFGALLAERRANPADDLLSVLATSDKLDDLERGTLAIEIMSAGWETVAAAIAGFVYHLITHGEDGRTHYRGLHDHPENIESKVEEMLRMLPIGRSDGLPRVLLADRTYSGTTLEAGSIVFLSHDAAQQRDTEAFQDPDAPNRHLAFHIGRHTCLGLTLARWELRIALERLTQRIPDLRLATREQIRWNTTSSIRRPLKLLVKG